MFNRFVFYFIIVFANGSIVFAGTHLSWEECKKVALEKSYELLEAKSKVRSARLAIQSEKGGYWPQISASVGTAKTTIEDAEPTIADTASVNLTQRLFSGFQTARGVERREAVLTEAEYSYQETNAKVLYDLTAAFSNVAYAQAVTTLSDDILKRRNGNLKLVSFRYKLGRENKGALLLSQANVSAAEFEILQSRNQLREAKLELAKVLGIDIEEAESLSVSPGIPLTPAPTTVAFDKVAMVSPEYARLKASVEVSRLDVELARSAFFPSLNASVSALKSGGSGFRDASNSWTIGLNLEIPLFSGGTDYFKFREAKESEYSSELRFGRLGLELKAKFRAALDRFIEADKRLEVDQELLEAAKVRSTVSFNKYNSGLLDFENWDIIESSLIERQKAHIRSMRERILAQAEWERLTGKGLQ